MLVGNPQSKVELLERTRIRNQTVWVSFGWGDILEPLANEQASMNLLNREVIEGYLAVTDELYLVQDYKKDQLNMVALAEVDQDRLIAREKAETERNKLALKMAGEEAVHLARLYDAKVRAIIMDAKEYAAAVEREQIDIERRKAMLAVAKEENRLKQINAEIYLEYINRAMVEADIAKMKLEAAKARVRAILADIEAQQADIRLIEAELAEAMAKADKATLIADVAMIYAEIVVKRLAEVRLDVETQEIEKGFEWLQEKMDKLLRLWDAKVRVELYRAEAEEQILAAVLALIASELEAEDIKLEEAYADERIFDHEEEKTAWGLEQEAVLAAELTKKKEQSMEIKNEYSMRLDRLQRWAKLIANEAQRWVHKNHKASTTDASDYQMYVEKGTSG